MNIVIPLCGLGERFARQGYEQPKPLISALTKPILQWAIDCLRVGNNPVYIAYGPSLDNVNFEDKVRGWYPAMNLTFVHVKEQTRGAADTIHRVALELDNDLPILCVDGDSFYTCDICSLMQPPPLSDMGALCVFNDAQQYDSPPYSYVKTDSTGDVVGVAEKRKISDAACTGAYLFPNRDCIVRHYPDFSSCSQEAELYTSALISHMISRGVRFAAVHVPPHDYHNLGTPLHLQVFCNNYPANSLYNIPKVAQKRICFDLDNTLVTSPQVPGDYATVLPIQKNITMCNYLKKLGHVIIIHTARRMRTHGGNVAKVTADVGMVTMQTLADFGIQYDELLFGKPYADYYIDDKAIDANGNLEKALGCYTAVTPRHFNSCELTTYKTMVKRSAEGLEGEIYYYSNVPPEIKDMFPIFFGHRGSCEYEIEFVEGISVSKQLMGSPDAVLDIIPHIFKSFRRIHEAPCDETFPIDVGELYIPKMARRYQEHFETYSQFEDTQEIFDSIVSYFESSTLRHICVMHGDPVFSNIMINTFGKFKFIDMRGMVGDVATLRGDMYYDYGKLYQSIIGYDYILNDYDINFGFVSKASAIFEAEVGDAAVMRHVKMITACLIFSMIPLHDSHTRRARYMGLIGQLL